MRAGCSEEELRGEGRVVDQSIRGSRQIQPRAIDVLLRGIERRKFCGVGEESREMTHTRAYLRIIALRILL